jgi:hypothetical protein
MYAKAPKKKVRRKPGASRPGRPKKPSRDERDQLERDAMGIFDPSKQFPPEPPCPTEDAVINAMSQAKFSGGRDLTLDEVRAQLQEILEKPQQEKIQVGIRTALLALGFKTENTSLSIDKFLQMLLPKISKGQRYSRMVEALQRILPIFVPYFQKGGTGWPKTHLGHLMEIPIDRAAEGVAKALIESMGEHVNLKVAIRLSPYILSWNKIRTSSQMRGSISQRFSQK